jgi:hypothetical protein
MHGSETPTENRLRGKRADRLLAQFSQTSASSGDTVDRVGAREIVIQIVPRTQPEEKESFRKNHRFYATKPVRN